ncbi:hypothetical protein NY2A_b009L [Paramecium bursaria Chlorella virus NY2A]|uniref:Uncharacterized protein b009L n=1 Tax=Paramecium bursaria Chlorella virus NY2A TaxID=46021 RepID=A7IVN4_PBCVN|nr:hypothetical protein NY2A_b009L [Paramecium bursaria Chlorella virus NY2A]ABT14408.1 hypothetical protein NY2A_b009L [Paramecium bursaria Chlorella virus NY2A]
MYIPLSSTQPLDTFSKYDLIFITSVVGSGNKIGIECLQQKNMTRFRRCGTQNDISYTLCFTSYSISSNFSDMTSMTFISFSSLRVKIPVTFSPITICGFMMFVIRTT